MSDAFYVTTPIYYVNGTPHLGHAYTSIVADALARYHRMLGDATRFVTGTDEHGQKIEEEAAKRQKAPKEMADEIVNDFKQAWTALRLSHDDFIRTTEQRHKDVVLDMWKRMEAAGDIYLGSYDGWYCVGCESFYPESQLVSGQCPIHETDVKRISEPSYFFRMSKYQDALLAHFESHPDFVQPANYRNEILSFIRGGLRDLSISRTTFKWGIPSPADPEHVIYVWIDALTNYISALGGPDSKDFQTYWSESVHILGKDILRFHAVYWPCMLLSAGLPLPKHLLVHGWWTVKGAKISKSMPATRVDPVAISKDLHPDPLRYFLLREVPFGPDGDFTYEGLLDRYNAELANDPGNLLNRSLTLAVKNTDGSLADIDLEAVKKEPFSSLWECARKTIQSVQEQMNTFAPSKALEEIWTLVRETNRFIDSMAPWKLAKDPAQHETLGQVIRLYLESIYAITRMLCPFLPEKASAMLLQMGLGGEQAQIAQSKWPSIETFGRALPTTLTIEKPTPLFPRLDDKQKEQLINQWLGEAGTSQAPPKDKTKMISFDEFQKLKLQVGKIVAADAIADADKLLKLQVDVGEEKNRQIVAGIATAFSPDQLIGKSVIVVANLKPAKIRGHLSEGMVLAAGDKDITGLATVDSDCLPGTTVR